MRHSLRSRTTSEAEELVEGLTNARRTSGLTYRSVALGCVFAAINSSVNMFFNFRYAGGLGQYWVIVVSYILFAKVGPRVLKSATHFGPREHCVVMLIGAAAAFSQSLGLSGGLAPLTLFYGRTFTLLQTFLWSYLAGLFGVVLGAIYGRFLVFNNSLPWPIAAMNAGTIRSFHFSSDDGSGPRSAAMKLFFLFFAITFPWYLLANLWLQFLLPMPILCWICAAPACQILGEGLVGVGIPGVVSLRLAQP